MLKPPNVVNVYPLMEKRQRFELPSEWAAKKSLVIFNVQSELPNDMMTQV